MEEGRALNDEEQKVFQSATGTLMYISPDRPDCQFSIRELQKATKNPTYKDMMALIRVARYLSGTKSDGIEFRPGGDGVIMNVFSDTDWASCKKTRKSTACATYVLGGCLIHAYSRGLSMICLSSGEAEFNGGVAACSEGIFFQSIFAFHGMPIKLRVWLDSSAARGVFQRQGVGRIRHLEAKSLWVQEGLRRKQFELCAVGTDDNTADIGTKALSEGKLVKHKESLKVWSEERFLQGGSGGQLRGVNAIEVVQRLAQAMMILGVSNLPSAEAYEDETHGEGWSVAQAMIWFSVIWMALCCMGLIIAALSKSLGQARTQVRKISVAVQTEAVREEQGVIEKSPWDADAATSSGIRRRQIGEVVICKYGRVAHFRKDCTRLKSSRAVNQQALPLCTECGGGP